MSILLRIDDFPGTKPQEFDRHNLESFKRFHAVLAERDIEYLLGVIPLHSTDEQLDWLAGRKYIVPAMHGVNHDERFQNEFGHWLTDIGVYSALAVAKDILERILGPIDVYIPPHNAVDLRTCLALRRLGFSSVAAGPETSPEALGPTGWISTSGLKALYSDYPKEYGRSDELITRGSVEHLRHVSSLPVDVYLTLHWTWEHNLGRDYGDLKSYLDSLEGMFGRWRSSSTSSGIAT